MALENFPTETLRARPRPRGGLNVEAISEKTGGNYLMSFGFPGSGKTTFQWMLMNYIMNEGPFRTEISVPDGPNGPDWEGRRIINEWKSQWISGAFPEATQSSESDIREIAVHTATSSGKKMAVDFSFLEVSGELLQLAMPAPGHDPHLVPTLHAYFSNPRLKFTLMLMLHPDVEENDLLFPSFISFLDREFPGLKDRMSLGVIISKPEASLAKLREFGDTTGRQYFGNFDEEALEAYLNRFCGETFEIWNNWPAQNKILLSPLYLGDIGERQGAPILEQPDFHHIEQIFLWLFEQFTGKRPGLTFWQKLRGKVDWN